ncbi:hypothetical protein SDRG_17214 [Saprolegnia diclina VS20]|uniref:Phosphoglycerate mutase n=1 Tax=Saprolegnia diclina (strain VS20) TaxID=1156394 RepID=T0QYR8_SAPDV|nr:hypothetical protein SDRG_17214 [Saprolegnia diclina VS20]EQC24893.1 hypothetical protein SDRG_17214 [Saprolegnia diclina VS20]|eukprot:XP_008621675.1 hypothetical protein SDRG_17214 [Saprolegnia diclina VS20]
MDKQDTKPPRVVFESIPRLFAYDATPHHGVFDHYERETPSWHALTKLPLVQEPSVKVLYWVRHAEGHHNAAERFYGTPTWDATVSLSDEYLDAALNDAGLADARNRSTHMLYERHIGLPLDKIIVSPLTRTLQTAHELFRLNDSSVPSVPIIAMENCRETLGVHTCDKRSPRSALVEAFPKVNWSLIDDEEDTLWSPSHRETNDEIQMRCHAFLDDVFTRIPDKYIAIVSHAGFIQNCMVLLRYPNYKPKNCETIPTVVQRTLLAPSVVAKQLPPAERMMELSSLLTMLLVLVLSCRALRTHCLPSCGHN